MPKKLPRTNYETVGRAIIVLDFTDTGYAYLENPQEAVQPIVAEVCKRLAPLGVQPTDIQIEFES